MIYSQFYRYTSHSKKIWDRVFVLKSFLFENRSWEPQRLPEVPVSGPDVEVDLVPRNEETPRGNVTQKFEAQDGLGTGRFCGSHSISCVSWLRVVYDVIWFPSTSNWVRETGWFFSDSNLGVFSGTGFEVGTPLLISSFDFKVSVSGNRHFHETWSPDIFLPLLDSKYLPDTKYLPHYTFVGVN